MTRYSEIETLRAAGLSGRLPEGESEIGRGVAFQVRMLRADLGNFSLYHYKNIDGVLATGKNSGTHWLRHMLSHVIAYQYGLDPPQYTSGPDTDLIIDHPRRMQRRKMPVRIGTFHNIPSILHSWRLPAKLLRHPPVVILIRDIRHALVSNYLKWEHVYRISFDEYLRGDPLGRKFIADIWWYVHFFNRWGDLAASEPHHLTILRYEDVQKSPRDALETALSHWNIPFSADAIEAGLRFQSREAIQTHLNPDIDEIVVTPSERTRRVTISEQNQAFIDAVFARFLRHDFGYGYPTTA